MSSVIRDFSNFNPDFPSPKPATKYQRADDRKQISEVGSSGFKSPCFIHDALCYKPIQGGLLCSIFL
jgi:hypothetical protein